MKNLRAQKTSAPLYDDGWQRPELDIPGSHFLTLNGRSLLLPSPSHHLITRQLSETLSVTQTSSAIEIETNSAPGTETEQGEEDTLSHCVGR